MFYLFIYLFIYFLFIYFFCGVIGGKGGGAWGCYKMETKCMKYQNLFAEKKKENRKYFKMSSAGNKFFKAIIRS